MTLFRACHRYPPTLATSGSCGSSSSAIPRALGSVARSLRMSGSRSSTGPDSWAATDRPTIRPITGIYGAPATWKTSLQNCSRDRSVNQTSKVHDAGRSQRRRRGLLSQDLSSDHAPTRSWCERPPWAAAPWPPENDSESVKQACRLPSTSTHLSAPPERAVLMPHQLLIPFVQTQPSARDSTPQASTIFAADKRVIGRRNAVRRNV